ncbi:MAG: asparaginase [Rhodospirillaceae bacterium]|nr:asparaginase [Rhodospirillaceae bacterium]MBT4464742.1 asparaginase [Rhodospirillaceae bacterium]MBT6407213.1 asparaginase [Rhodospirillaceae bacterium]MBT7355851.1 asparaginase [Rhodospirillaceae bacterium]
MSLRIMDDLSENPVLVEVTRGEMVESRHRGAVCVTDAAGTVIAGLGDIERAVYPRSAIKPLQALSLVESGADISAEELALACASHNGEPEHVDLACRWLGRLGLDVDDLECGPSVMMEGLTGSPTRAHNNCSGKHTGFLATALDMGELSAGYIGVAHPVQQRVRRILGEITDLDLSNAPEGIDGCGIPVLAMPLHAMALGLARMADPSALTSERATAAQRITRAMMEHPFLVAGSGRFDTRLMAAVKEPVVVKTGAEGVHAAILPNRGLGVALKIDDGAKRAAEVTMAAVLSALGVANIADDLISPVVLNAVGEEVGVIRPCLQTDGFPTAGR